MVDEYQDTNVIQDRILSLVAAPEYNLCVVGDDDQSIYRFRGATVQNFLNFPNAYPDARQVVLSRNFRSTEPIISFASRLIAHNAVRYAKALVAHRGTGPEVLLVTARDVDDEGQALAELISELFRSRIIERWSDVAVLFSSVKHYASPLVGTCRAWYSLRGLRLWPVLRPAGYSAIDGPGCLAWLAELLAHGDAGWPAASVGAWYARDS